MNALGRYTIVFGIAGNLMFASLCGATAAEFCPADCSTGKIPLGISAPTSGPRADFGRQATKSAEIAVRELNANGGLMGTSVQLIEDDDRCDPGLSASVAKRHVEKEKLHAVIGPVCPSAAETATPIYAEAGVIQLLPTASTMEPMRQSSTRIFRLVLTDEQEAQALGAYLASEQKGKKLVIVYRDVFYRREMIEQIRAALPSDMQGAQFKPLLASSSAYDQLADQLQRDKPDLIYLAIENDMVVEVVSKLRNRNVRALFLGGQRLFSQDLWRAASKAAEGIHIIAAIETPISSEFGKIIDLLLQANVVPDLVALNSYAAIQIWAEAVRRAGTGDPAKIVDTLRTGEFQTAIGLVAFDQQGDRRDVRTSVWSWEGGRLRQHVKGDQR